MSHLERLDKEAAFYEQEFAAGHPLNRFPLFSRLRNKLAYDVARFHLAKRAGELMPNAENVLLAPCGVGADLYDFGEVWRNARFSGIDISPRAKQRVLNATVGDILNMPFESESFDAVVSTLFFHHVADEGFEPYLREIARVLRRGGVLATMEPSEAHPLFAVTRLGKKLFGNITGHVEHEHPISIPELEAAMLRCGFDRVESFACSFGHNRIPIPITTMLNFMTRIPSLKYLAWQVGVLAFRARD